MLSLTIIALGKLKEKHYQAAVAEYLKRLAPYAKIKVEELKVEPFTESNKAKAKEVEGGRLLAFLERYEPSQVVLLDERGQEFTSHGLADFLDKASGGLVFVIGGTQGFSASVLEKYQHKLALSRLTLPHELARVVLAEQLYRAVTILKGKDYHY